MLCYVILYYIYGIILYFIIIYCIIFIILFSNYLDEDGVREKHQEVFCNEHRSTDAFSTLWFWVNGLEWYGWVKWELISRGFFDVCSYCFQKSWTFSPIYILTGHEWESLSLRLCTSTSCSCSWRVPIPMM